MGAACIQSASKLVVEHKNSSPRISIPKERSCSQPNNMGRPNVRTLRSPKSAEAEQQLSVTTNPQGAVLPGSRHRRLAAMGRLETCSALPQAARRNVEFWCVRSPFYIRLI